MSGVIPKRGASGRKQWTVHDTSRGSLNGLRNQLANDGCPESQVVLAKQLLRDDQERDDNRANACLGVYWLIKASEQGNVEATELLKQCLISGKGISEQNYLDVKSCITMTQDEKLARKAAREMFASLSNGGEYITSEQLQKKMLEIDKDQENRLRQSVRNGDCVTNQQYNGELMNHITDDDSDEEVDWSQRSEKSDGSEKLTEDHLVEAAVHYSHGRLPLVNRVLSLTYPNLHALDHIPYVHRSILHPLLWLSIIYYKLIRFLGAASLNFLNIFNSDFQIVYLMFIYTLVSTENMLFLIPIIIYCGTIIVMVVTTFKMLQTKREFFDFRVWSGLFLTYSGGSLNGEQAEYQYIKNNMKPYGHYFLALLANFFVYPIIAEVNIPQSELTILAFCATFMTLFGFMYKRRSKTVPDFWILLSFCVNVLAKYPYEADTVVTQGWRYLDLKIPTLASYIIGNGIEFCINFKSLLYACIPLIFCKIAYRENWRGIYKYLIPHCVTLSWFQVVVISSQGATMYGLIRGTLALVGVVMFLPLMGLTTILLPAAALSKWLMTNDHLYTACLFLLFVVMGVSICFIIARSRFSSYTSQAQVVLAIIALYFFIDNAIHENASYAIEKQLQKTISYEGYQKFCHEHAWTQSNLATAQIRCAKLEGVQVTWEGYVHQVRIKSRRNTYKYVIDKLPEGIRQYMTCYFGDEIVPDCDDKSEDCLLFYDIVQAMNGGCHLDRHDVYAFEIIVKMHSGIWGKGADVHLTADAVGLKKFALKLRQDDQIWFKGSLVRSGDRRVHVKVTELGCTTCQDDTLLIARMRDDETAMDYDKILACMAAGLRTVLNCIFYPIFVFK